MTAVDLYQALINIAATYIGVVESGGDNRGPMVEQFQKALDGKAQGEPWCAAFMAFCIKQIEDTYFVKTGISLSEHCMTMWNSSARAQVKIPKPGVLCVWKFKGTSSGHVGLVCELDPDKKHFYTIEGNTGPGVGIEREGDGVFRKKRSLISSDGFQLMGFLDPWK